MSKQRELTQGEEITNVILHGVGLGLAIAALVVLVVLATIFGTQRQIVSFSIYGATLILLYLSSTLYHSFPPGRVKNIFKIFDHAAIYLLIAGTYTPITLVTLRGALGWGIFIVVWVIAIIGISFKIFFVNKFKILSTVLYILMGWLIVVAIKPLFLVLNQTSKTFLVLGGVLYTAGTIFYVWHNLKYHHAIWHLFVLAGSICHFFTMLFLILQ